MDQSPLGGQAHSMAEVWIKAEPIDDEPSAYFHIKCDNEIDVVKIEPTTFTIEGGELQETVDIKSEIASGDYECITSSHSSIGVQFKKNGKRKARGSDKRFKCDECGATYASKTYFQDHLRKHTGERPFACDECGKTFFRKEILSKHIRLHSGEKPHACDICGMRFAQKGHVKPHKRTHTGERPFSCDVCDLKFMYKSVLKHHQKIHTSEQPSSAATVSSTIEDHSQEEFGGDKCVQKIIDKRYNCEECGAKFSRKDGLEIHQRKHTGERPFACDECGTRFMYKSVLNRHKKIHNSEQTSPDNVEGLSPKTVTIKSEITIGDYECISSSESIAQQLTKNGGEKAVARVNENRFSCDECGSTFASRPYLLVHQRKHTGERPFACDECGKTFFRKEILTKHIRLHSGEKPHACDICGMRFAQKGHVKPHKRKHTGERPYSCDECGTKFMYKSILDRHKRVHACEQSSSAVGIATVRRASQKDVTVKSEIMFDGYESVPTESIAIAKATDKRYSCDECGATFASKYYFTIHQRKHTGERPFACDECGKTFFRKEILSKHKRLHSGEKPHACDICGMRFAQKGHVKPHKRKHTGEKPFSCDVCDMKFMYKSGLKHHTKLHTSESPST